MGTSLYRISRREALVCIKSMLPDIHKIVAENVGTKGYIDDYIEENAGTFLGKGLEKLNISELRGVIFLLEQLTRRP